MTTVKLVELDPLQKHHAKYRKFISPAEQLAVMLNKQQRRKQLLRSSPFLTVTASKKNHLPERFLSGFSEAAGSSWTGPVFVGAISKVYMQSDFDCLARPDLNQPVLVSARP